MENPFVTLCNRYAVLIKEALIDPCMHSKRLCHPNLLWMLDQIVINETTWPLDKTGRWLGFTQGVMAAQGLIDVDAERDYSRPLFHAYYKSQGKEIPETLSI